MLQSEIEMVHLEPISHLFCLFFKNPGLETGNEKRPESLSSFLGAQQSVVKKGRYRRGKIKL